MIDKPMSMDPKPIDQKPMDSNPDAEPMEGVNDEMINLELSE
jgi:hypothetical protein